MSKHSALRALKQERRNDVALYVEAIVPDAALASRQVRKAAKVAHPRRIPVRP